MIQLTWRQFRAQALAVFGLLAVIAVALAVTGPALVHLYFTSVAPCAKHNDCAVADAALINRDHLLQGLGIVLIVVPGLLGVFWGAPLIARELETGTYKLAWTQGITRRRWLATKLIGVGLASVAVSGLLSLMLTWWASPIDRVNADPFALFDQRGIVPLGYAAFAFALGVTAGLLTRRTVPAMVVTLAVFAGARLGMTWLRWRLFAPLRIIVPLRVNAGNLPSGTANPTALAAPHPGDFVTSNVTIDGAGKVIGQQGIINFGNGVYGLGFQVSRNGKVGVPGVGLCPNKFPPAVRGGGPGGPGLSHSPGGTAAFQQAAQQCYDKLGIRELLTYVPTTRYWPLQWSEVAIFTVLALILAGFTFLWLRRRFP
jgi:ABC-type transport system involved in multi-copper enzyme maturation permease subunit